MAFLSNSQLTQFSCGDVVPGSTGMLTLPFGPGGVWDQSPFWFGWYGCNKGDELKRWKNTETYVGYYVTKGKFDILSEGETKTVSAGDWISLPPQTDYEVKALEDGSELVWVYYPPKAG